MERLVAERAMGQIEEAYENLVCANDEIIRRRAKRIAQQGAKVCAATARSDLSFHNKGVEEERGSYE